MIDVYNEIDNARQEREDKRLVAIAALEGFLADTVPYDDYEQAVSEYSEALEYVIELENS